MGQDSADIGNVARQITEAQQAALRCMKGAYHSQNGKGAMNGNLTRQGQQHLNTANSLIEDNLQPIVDSLKNTNFSAVMQAMIASGVSYEAAANAARILMVAHAKSVALKAAEGATTLTLNVALVEALQAAGIAITALVAAIGLAFLCCKLYDWLTSDKTQDKKPVARQYERNLGKPTQYKPFQMPVRPGRVGG
jgi:hypothetical protein